MVPNGEWQVVRRRRRFPDNWKTPSAAELNKVKPYKPYNTKPTFAEMVARNSPNSAIPSGNGVHRGSSNSPQNSSRSTSPQTPPGTQYFYSPHSPTRLRFSPHSSFPEWRGRCFRCCRIGHTQAQCRNPRRCGKCWNYGHVASKCKLQMLNPAARPFHPTVTHGHKPSRSEPMFDELLKGEVPSLQPSLPEGRPEKLTVFLERDEDFFQEVERLNRAVVMYGAYPALGLDAHHAVQIAVSTKLVREDEIRVSNLSGERFLIQLPEGLAVETFVRALPGDLWDQGFTFQQWSLLDDATVKMPRFKVLLDLMGVPPHQWRENSVIKATVGIGLYLGTVANEHASDLSAWRIAIATDDLLKIPDNLTLVVGGLEYPVQVKPISWERGPIYTSADFPILPQRFSRPPPPLEPVRSEKDSDSDGQNVPNGEELLSCSRRALMEICQGRSMSSIPPEIRAFISGSQVPGEFSINTLEELVFATGDQGNTEEHYFQTGHTTASQAGQGLTEATQMATEPVHREFAPGDVTASLNIDFVARLPNQGTPNETRNKSGRETAQCSVLGTVPERLEKGKQPLAPHVMSSELLVKESTVGQKEGDSKLTGQVTMSHRTHQVRGRGHESRGVMTKHQTPFTFPTSRHNRFKDVMGRGRGKVGTGNGSRHVTGQKLMIGRPGDTQNLLRGPRNTWARGRTSAAAYNLHPDAGRGLQKRSNYKWSRGAQSIPVEVINEGPKGRRLGQGQNINQVKTILKRKPNSWSLEINGQTSQEGPSKRPTQGTNQSFGTDQPAYINLNPGAFFEVTVEKTHCLAIAQGCGLNQEMVEKALKEDNTERRTEMQLAVQPQDVQCPDDQEGAQVNLDSASEDDLSADEHEC